MSSALAKKWSFLTMKEPWSQFSSLGQSHNGLILESGLVFMPWMLSPILCGATTVSALRPSAHPHRGFQMLILPRLGAQLFSPVVRGACSLSLPLFGPLKCPYQDIPGNPTQSMAEGLPGGVTAAFPGEAWRPLHIPSLFLSTLPPSTTLQCNPAAAACLANSHHSRVVKDPKNTSVLPLAQFKERFHHWMSLSPITNNSLARTHKRLGQGDPYGCADSN